MKDNEILNRPILLGHRVPAEYISQQVPAYKGNPLIEALPPLYSPNQLFELLTQFPVYDDLQRSWDLQTRMHCVQQIENCFMQPLPYHVNLESSISRTIWGGYSTRNPMSPVFNRQFTVGFKKILQSGLDEEGRNLLGNRPSGAGFSIVGLSGVGKSTAVERTLLLYPQVIRHTKYQRKPFVLDQLVWLKLECPASGSLKVLGQNFFRQVDLVLGTHYFETHVKTGSTKETLVGPIAQVASLHGLGVLIVDEIQRLKRVKNSGGDEMLNYFTELINSIGVPIILIGTYKSMFLFDTAFAEARRASGQGDHILSNLKKDAKWDLFLRALWRLQWTQKVCPLTDELNAVMYKESQGIPDIAIKLYMNAQWSAMYNRSEEITPTLIRDVAERCLKLLRKMLTALKNGDTEALKKYEDLKPDWLTLDDYIKKSEETLIMQGQLAAEHTRTLKNRDVEEQLLDLKSFAVKLGFSELEGTQFALQVVQTSQGDEDLPALRQHLARLALGTQAESSESKQVVDLAKKRKQKRNSTPTTDDPWRIVYDSLKQDLSIHDILLKADLLKPPSELMI